MAFKHRGRFQAQGGGLEESESWGQDEPISKVKGLELLSKLKNKLKKKDRELREKQFDAAERYVEQVEGGIDAVKKKTFRNRKTKDVRVDIEVLSGRAFICMAIFIILWVLYKIA